MPFCGKPNCPDGAVPQAKLIDVSGLLYGTTTAGGQYDWGTIFSLNPATGVETVLHTFTGGSDGQTPYAGLIDVKGKLYGTTVYGGSSGYGWGTVFSFDLQTGREKVAYSFCATCSNDGYYPYAGLIEANGLLYGTTAQAGSTIAGTVFSLDPGTGAETQLHAFCYGTKVECTDGQFPQAGLIEVNGILYGATQSGGTGSYRKGRYGFGTLYSLDPNTGAETVVHSFCSEEKCLDGLQPYADLIDANGTLYGTTYGVAGRHYHPGGNVFSFDPGTGAVTNLYSFCSRRNCVDGQSPQAGLVKLKDKLYGTTARGGAHGAGVVFAVGIP